MDRTDVTIGEPASIDLQQAHVGTNLRVSLSCCVEHAAVRVDGALIQLPPPSFVIGTAPAAGEQPSTAKLPFELASIDEIVRDRRCGCQRWRHLEGRHRIGSRGSGFSFAVLPSSGRAEGLT